VNVNSDASAIPVNDGSLTLREAIAYVNGTAPQALDRAQIDESVDPLGQNDIITFAPGLAGGTITLTQGELVISESVTIDGADANGVSRNIMIDAGDGADQMPATGDGSRIFYQYAGDVTLKNLKLTGGDVSGQGGAIYSASGDLTIVECTIAGNASSNTGSYWGGGGVSFTRQQYETETLTILSSTISGNSAGGNGGGLYFHTREAYGSVTIDNSTFDGNQAVSSTDEGGGIFGETAAAQFLAVFLVSGVFASWRIRTRATSSGTAIIARGFCLTDPPTRLHSVRSRFLCIRETGTRCLRHILNVILSGENF
jgi:hypothetical protein